MLGIEIPYSNPLTFKAYLSNPSPPFLLPIATLTASSHRLSIHAVLSVSSVSKVIYSVIASNAVYVINLLWQIPIVQQEYKSMLWVLPT